MTYPPESVPEGGLKNNQIGRLTAIVYHASTKDRAALARELRDYLEVCEGRAVEKMQKEHPELFPDDSDGEHGDAYEPEDAATDDNMHSYAKGDKP